MVYQYIFDPVAADEYEDAFKWYEHKSVIAAFHRQYLNTFLLVFSLTLFLSQHLVYYCKVIIKYV
jgi:hypothetical protein